MKDQLLAAGFTEYPAELFKLDTGNFQVKVFWAQTRWRWSWTTQHGGGAGIADLKAFDDLTFILTNEFLYCPGPFKLYFSNIPIKLK